MKAITKLPQNLIGFIKNVLIELKLVEFPTRKFTLKNTHLVIVLAIAISIALLLIDGLFNYARNYLTLNI